MTLTPLQRLERMAIDGEKREALLQRRFGDRGKDSTRSDCVRDTQAARAVLAHVETLTRERDQARAQLADLIDRASQASASDGGWLAALLQRFGRG